MGMGVPRRIIKEMIEHNGRNRTWRLKVPDLVFLELGVNALSETHPRRLPNDSCRTEIAYLDRFCTDGVQLRACWNPAD